LRVLGLNVLGIGVEGIQQLIMKPGVSLFMLFNGSGGQGFQHCQGLGHHGVRDRSGVQPGPVPRRLG
jgi:hypothetical protein